MNYAVSGKTMASVKKHGDIRRRRRNYLVSQPNYHTTKFFPKHLSAKEMKKNRDTYE